MSNIKNILIVSANPVWQKHLEFDEFPAKSGINRAISKLEYCAGKGTNAARALKCLQGKRQGLILQFCGGMTGQLLEEDEQRQKLNFVSVKTAAATRCCTTCLCRGQTNEIIEPSADITSEEEEKFIAEFKQILPLCEAAMICGSTPKGISKNFYPRMAAFAAECHKMMLVDTVVDTLDILKANPRSILKVNANELAAITGCVAPEDGIVPLHKDFPQSHIGVTDEDRRALLMLPEPADEILECLPEYVKQPVSVLGAGDTASAVMLASLLDGMDGLSAFEFALYAASENCKSPIAGQWK